MTSDARGEPRSQVSLVLAGAWIYWRAARDVSVRSRRDVKLAAMIALLIGAFGTLILALDVAS